MSTSHQALPYVYKLTDVDFLRSLLLISLEAIIIVPALIYILWGRYFRRRMILSYFTPGAIAQYFEQFWAGDFRYATLAKNYRFRSRQDAEGSLAQAAAHDLRDGLRDLYNIRFGFTAYIIPVAILVFILAEEGLLVADYVAAELTSVFAASAGSHPAATSNDIGDHALSFTVASISGAYLWIGLTIISRSSALTLLPWDLNFFSLRLLVAPMMGHAAATLDNSKGVLIAFVITMLPMSEIFSWLRAAGAKFANVTQTPEEMRDKVVNLAGVDSSIAASLQDQSVTTIRQLIDSDPVQLSMRTGLDFTFIVTLIDQAIAWSYFGTDALTLGRYGWGGASNIIDTADAWQSHIPDVEQAALGLADAKRAADAADVALTQASQQDSQRPALVTARDQAQAALPQARKTFESAQNLALVDEMATDNDLHLKREGLRNAVRAIGADTYARFIRSLIRDIQAPPTPAPPTSPKATGLNLFLQRFGIR